MADETWQKTACILCECNCGVEVRLDGREIVRVRGDKEHKASAGYTCEKALRLNHYQNGRHRLTSPMRRRDDGSYEEIDWETAMAAGERRSFTANTIFRDPDWRKKDRAGALRMSADDAAALGVADGAAVRVTTAGGSMTTVVEINDSIQPGHVTLPNGQGVDYPDAGGDPERTGVPPNELTYLGHQDPFAGTPWHKHVPARVEAV